MCRDSEIAPTGGIVFYFGGCDSAGTPATKEGVYLFFLVSPYYMCLPFYFPSIYTSIILPDRVLVLNQISFCNYGGFYN